MKRRWLANTIYIWCCHVWLAKSGFFQVGFNYGDYLDYFTTRDAKDCQVYMWEICRTNINNMYTKTWTTSQNSIITFNAQARCQSYVGCQSFSFYSSNAECYMKRAVINRKQNAEVLASHGKDKLDTAAVPIFVVILVELTTTVFVFVFVNSTNIFWDGSAV